jgi:hypothetical protein
MTYFKSKKFLSQREHVFNFLSQKPVSGKRLQLYKMAFSKIFLGFLFTFKKA